MLFFVWEWFSSIAKTTSASLSRHNPLCVLIRSFNIQRLWRMNLFGERVETIHSVKCCILLTIRLLDPNVFEFRQNIPKENTKLLIYSQKIINLRTISTFVTKTYAMRNAIHVEKFLLNGKQHRNVV